jgi:hypothetical protein
MDRQIDGQADRWTGRQIEGDISAAAESLKPDGTFMVVEPATGETPSENLHLLGGIFYGYSTLMSLPASKVQEFGLGSDAQAGEKRIPLVLKDAEFSIVFRVVGTQVDMILDARV